MTTCVKHDFSVLRAAILLKFSFLSFKYVLLVFIIFFFSHERDKCGAAAVAGFFQVFLSYFLIKEKKTFKITVYCNKAWLNSTCYHFPRRTPGDLSFFLTRRSIPHPQAHTKRQS